ncbi:hypothetical protein [Streptomyces sp. NPDC051636]|uniref:hypothetical protein n=1 Tax=Streptomyces sp. NPDC051636 TaxID=3365663 RepID=UPI00379367FA
MHDALGPRQQPGQVAGDGVGGPARAEVPVQGRGEGGVLSGSTSTTVTGPA